MISVPVNSVMPDLVKLKRKLHIQSEREEKLLQLVMDEFKLLVDPRYAYRKILFNELPFKRLIEESKDLRTFMDGAEEGFVVIATLHGAIVPDEPVFALYGDRVLSDMAENLAEYASKVLLSKFYAQDRLLTRRYSPGYGDLPLYNQELLFSLFSDTKLDVKLNDHYYMEPEKSISYIVGVRKDECE